LGCQGSGFCELGCPFDAKQNAAKVLLPRALRLGARVLADVRVVRVVHRGGRVRGVAGIALDARGQPRATVEVTATAVVLAGSAVGSAVLAGRSALPDPFRTLGYGLRLHPGVAIAGWFDEPVDAHRGIPQSYECTEWLEPSPRSDRRVWITTVFAHPVGAAAMLPGFGAEHRRWMLRYRHLAALTAMVHDESSGHVGVRPDGRARIDYAMSCSDRRQLALGVRAAARPQPVDQTACRAAARLLLAAGAREVLVPSSPPHVLDDPGQVERIPESVADPRSIAVTSVHPLGTLRLGDDPRRAVVNSAGEHHQVEGLFVLDGSLFPTSLGVPPQLSVYAFARHLAPRVLDRLGA
ncbi:MAG TPA: GMC family oxidoreductase, partial [Polyangiaceae bacterium]|nr:GMC family oxidoreductase [Polyangiaceae bacterium]